MNLPRLFLASQSPRRAHILQTLGIPFVQAASSFDEPAPTPRDEAAPAQYVETLARLKAAHCVFPDGANADGANADGANADGANADGANADGANAANSLVLSADTIVWHEGKILGKPRDQEEARSMLQSLQGREHQVYTGVCLRRIENIEAIEIESAKSAHEYSCGHDITTVRFIRVSDQWIARYVATGEPMDKAGAYAAQGRGAALVERIEGDFWNVVGLPLAPLRLLLETVKAPIEDWWD